MAKLRVIGDVIQLKSDLTAETINLVKGFEPNALNIINEDGNATFGIGIGKASVSAYGVCFPSTDASGKVFVTIENVADHSDPEAEKYSIRREYAPILAKLIIVEQQIKDVAERIGSLEDSVDDLIEFEI